MKSKDSMIRGAEADRVVERALKAGWVLRLRRRSWGNRKKLASEMLEEKFQADSSAIRAVQKLIECIELDNVNKCISYITGRVDKLSQPWLGEGFYFFLEDRVAVMEEELKNVAAEMAKRLEEFLVVYADRKAEYKAKHPKLYKEEYYPTAVSLRAKFRLEWYWQRIRPTVGGEDVGVVGKEIVDRELAKFRDQVKAGVEGVVESVKQATLEVFEHLASTLKDKDKKFKDTTVEKPKEFLDELARVVRFLDDKGMEKLIADSKDILNGVYGEDLRSDDEYRRAMGEVLGEVVEAFKAIPRVELERDIEL